MIAPTALEEIFAKNIDVAKRGSTSGHGSSADVKNKVNRLVIAKGVLCIALGKLGVNNVYEKVVVHCLLSGRARVVKQKKPGLRAG